MKSSSSIRPGIEGLPADGLAGRRVGLVAHPASLASDGRHSAAVLREAGVNLVALFGPEHGFFGRGGAGENIADAAHADWKIPIFSLYGETRAPTPAMLDLVDVFVFDVQTIAGRGQSRNLVILHTLLPVSFPVHPQAPIRRRIESSCPGLRSPKSPPPIHFCHRAHRVRS